MRTIVKLKNGKKVANFSSPHPFKFDDGSVLPSHTKENAIRLSIKTIEKLIGNGDVSLTFELSQDIIDECDFWINEKNKGNVDVVFCPFPMMTALNGIYSKKWLLKSPFRTVLISNRITKRVSSIKQCLIY